MKNISKELNSNSLQTLIDNNKVLSLTTIYSKYTLNSKYKPIYNKTSNKKKNNLKVNNNYNLIAKYIKIESINKESITIKKLNNKEIQLLL